MNRDLFSRPPTLVRLLTAAGFGLVAAVATGVAAGRLDAEPIPSGGSVAAAVHGAALNTTIPMAEPAASYAETAADDLPAAAATPRSAKTADRAPGSNRPSPRPSPAARVDLRCWQDGILIVNEKRLLPAVEPFPYVVKFPSWEPGGVPVYLGAWASATCVIKPAVE